MLNVKKLNVKTDEKVGAEMHRPFVVYIGQFNKTLKKAYEGLGNTMSVYNAFVQANINVSLR